MRRNEIERLLPSVFRRTVGDKTPLAALLEVMEHLHRPSEQVLTRLDSFVDPRRAPDAFVPFLASWVDLERIFEQPAHILARSAQSAGGGQTTGSAASPLSTGMGRLRELTASAAYLASWRGTKYGLLRYLEIATGHTEFEIDENVADAEGLKRPFHMRIRAPETLLAHRALLIRIIEEEKPAYVTYSLDFLPGTAKL